MRYPDRVRAFTVIELLVVISIIAILAGMILSTVIMVRQAALVSQTRTILHAALVGVSTTAMRTQVTISPVPHPLANTSSTPAVAGMQRSVFYRGETIATVFNKGDPVAVIGEGLTVDDPKTVAGSEYTRVLMPSDVYGGGSGTTDTDCPLIFGVDRQHLTVLGTGYGLIWQRHLPAIASWNDRNGDGVLDSPPYTATVTAGQVAYPDGRFLIASQGDLTNTTQFELDGKKLFDFSLGPEVETELTSLGAIRTCDITTGANIGTALISNNRVRLWPEGCAASYANYVPSQVRKGPMIRDTDGSWKPYHLRGPALYDAWGREILFYLASNGSITFESAGKDGYYRWNPGGNLKFDTDAFADTPVGDDTDASKDNLLTGQK